MVSYKNPGVSSENLGNIQWKSMGSPVKVLGISDENLVVSNEILGESNGNLGVSMKIGGLQRKSGISNENVGV